MLWLIISVKLYAYTALYNFSNWVHGVSNWLSCRQVQGLRNDLIIPTLSGSWLRLRRVEPLATSPPTPPRDSAAWGLSLLQASCIPFMGWLPKGMLASRCRNALYLLCNLGHKFPAFVNGGGREQGGAEMSTISSRIRRQGGSSHFVYWLSCSLRDVIRNSTKTEGNWYLMGSYNVLRGVLDWYFICVFSINLIIKPTYKYCLHLT